MNTALHPLHAQRGLTLLELLVAVALTALIALLSWQALDQALTLQQAGQAQRTRLMALQQALNFLQRDLLQMAPRPIRDEMGERQPAFLLTPDQAEWSRIALAEGPEGRPGLLRVGYRLHDGTLQRLIWPVMDRAPDTRPRITSLLENVTTWRLEALDPAAPVEQWTEEWHHPIRRPPVVRLTLQLKDMAAPLQWRFRILDLGQTSTLTGGQRFEPDIYEQMETP